jgi:hypothetical protein
MTKNPGSCRTKDDKSGFYLNLYAYIPLAGNVADMLADMSSRHSVSPCFGQQPTCHRQRDWESILVTCRLISRHNICAASVKLARRDRCLPMSS